MKKIFSLLTAVILMTTAFTGCSSKPKAKYNVLVDPDNAPYSERNGTEYRGLAIDILDAVAEESDFSVKYVSDMEKDDYSASISTLTDGSNGYDYTDYFYQQAIIFANSKSSDITAYEQLLHKTIGVMDNSLSQDFAFQIAPQYNINVEIYYDSNKLYRDAEKGKIDGMFDDELAVREKIKTGTKIKTFKNSEKANPLSFAVNKGENKQFVEDFNKGLKAINQDGTYGEILKKYTE